MTVVRHRVEMVGQSHSPVCWYACAMMLMQYKLRHTLRLDNFNIGMDPRIECSPNIGNNLVIMKALRSWGFSTARTDDIRINTRASRRRASLRTGSVTSLRATPRTRDQEALRTESVTSLRATPRSRVQEDESQIVQKIITILENFGPFILAHQMGAFSYGSSVTTPTMGNHAVLITGINTDRDVVYFNNPWGETACQTSIHMNVQTTISSIENAILRWERADSISTFIYLP